MFTFQISRPQQSKLVDIVRRQLAPSADRPISYDRHFYFVDFRRFRQRNPVYFSLVRDPVAKFESKFYYSRNIGGK